MKKQKTYTAEEVRQKMAEQREKWRQEWEKMPKHNFKKGQYLIEHNSDNDFTQMVKVVDCAPHILLVKSVEYSGHSIPYRAEPKDFGLYRVLPTKEYYKIKIKRVVDKVFLTPMLDASSWVSNQARRFDISHSRTPEGFKDYVGNWLAMGVTFWTRVQCYMWFDDSTLHNCFHDVTAHGPLWPKKTSK